MQKQKPGENNPANPLMKAVSLILEKEYEDVDLNKIRILSSLSFKKSSDMVGHTQSKEGKLVTVNFSLALKRANFELRFECEGINPRKSPVRIKRVAHSKPGGASTTINETETQKDVAQTAHSLGGKIGADLKPHSLLPVASANASVTTSQSRENSSKKIQTRKLVQDGVSATFTNDKISWEIGLIPEISGLNRNDDYLIGDIFAKKDGSQGFACTAFKVEKTLPIIITGSVSVRMQDLMIDSVQFTYEDGTEVRTKSLAGVSFNPLQTTSDTKLTVLKQIIRKHLIEGGMRVEGIRVEVCRANV